MPSWEVHEAIAMDTFGLRCSDVDRLIDTMIHDVGRRFPREPKLIEKLYNYRIIYEYIKEITKAKKILYQVSKDNRKAKCFWIHHILDLLAPRFIALETLKIPPDKYADNLVKSVIYEVRVVWNNISEKGFLLPSYTRYHFSDAKVIDSSRLENALEYVLSQLSFKIIDIIKHPVVRKWSSHIAWMREMYFNKSIRELIKPPNIEKNKKMNRPESARDTPDKKNKGKIVIRIRNYDDSIKALSKVSKGVISNPKYHYGRLMYRVSYIASIRSHLYDLALLSPLSSAIIGSFLLPVSKRNYSSLGRNALNHCEEIPRIEDQRKAIIDEVIKFWKTYLEKEGIPLPQGCAETYADTFLEGCKYVKTILN